MHFSEAEKIVLVCDNLNIHTPKSLHKCQPPNEATGTVPDIFTLVHARRLEWLVSVPAQLLPPFRKLFVLRGHPREQHRQLFSRASTNPTTAGWLTRWATRTTGYGEYRISVVQITTVCQPRPVPSDCKADKIRGI